MFACCPTIFLLFKIYHYLSKWKMEFTQLSLAGGLYEDGKSGSDGSGDGGMKRKWNTEAFPNTVDLQLKHPLPSDWEQCLDLQVHFSFSFVFFNFDNILVWDGYILLEFFLWVDNLILCREIVTQYLENFNIYKFSKIGKWFEGARAPTTMVLVSQWY